jgi:hypothetical protein
MCKGQAQLMTRLLSGVQIKGAIETSRTELHEQHKDVDQHQVDMYFMWVFCQTLNADKTLSTNDKLKLWEDARPSFSVKQSLNSIVPLLHVRPSVRDSFIGWKDGEFSPYSEHPGDPFAITITNISSANAINLTIVFALNIHADELVTMALTSPLFLGKNIQGDANKLTVPFRFGDQMSRVIVPLTRGGLQKTRSNFSARTGQRNHRAISTGHQRQNFLVASGCCPRRASFCKATCCATTRSIEGFGRGRWPIGVG